MPSLKTCTAAGALLVFAVACSDSSTQPRSAEASLVSAAFVTAAPGYDSLSSSFSADGKTGVFGPRHREGPRGMGGDSLGRGELMGGGIRGEFFGGIGMGPGLGRGPFGENFSLTNCTFGAATGVVTCAPVVRDSLTINRTFKFATAAGAAQATRDSATTDRIETTRSVTGTTTFTPGRREGFGHGFGRHDEAGDRDSMRVDITAARTTVTSSSSRVVTGLAAGSTKRTINGASSGRETTEGTNTNGAFTSVRVMGDTTTGVVIPSVTTGYPYPTAGTVIRSISVSVTFASGAPASSSRREVITYDGSATAKISITKDGATKQCTLALPRGKPVCP